MIKAVIFDIDGVLLESFDANFAYFKSVLAPFGYRFSKQHYNRNKHMTARQLIALASKIKAGEIEKIFQYSKKSVKYPLHLLRMTEGSATVIGQLDKNYKLALVTNRSKRGLNDFFKFSGLKKSFAVAITCEHVRHPKPHPQSLLIALKKLKVAPQEAVYIGDTKSDAKTAKAAGCHYISFGKTKHSKLFAKSFKQLPKIIKNLDYVQK